MDGGRSCRWKFVFVALLAAPMIYVLSWFGAIWLVAAGVFPSGALIVYRPLGWYLASELPGSGLLHSAAFEFYTHGAAYDFRSKPVLPVQEWPGPTPGSGTTGGSSTGSGGP